jgi:hypothetical protein
MTTINCDCPLNIEHITQPHSSKQMTIILPPGVQWVNRRKFTTTKTRFVTFSLPEFNLKKQMCSSWAFHVDDRSESSSTYDMIIGNQPRSSWSIWHNHELQWPYGHLGYWHYSNERQIYSTLSSVEGLIETMLIWVQMNHKRSEMNILELPIF